MSKFKLGDKVKLKADAQDWGWTKEECNQMKLQVFVVGDNRIGSPITDTVLECVTNYPDDFELVESAPQKHIHYDMIVKWASNPSRVVERLVKEMGSEPKWEVDNYPTWNPWCNYRFKLEESERVFPKTSLTDKELYDLWQRCELGELSRTDLANRIIKQYILEQEDEENTCCTQL